MNLDYNVFADDYQRCVSIASPQTLSQFIGRMKDDMEGEVDHEELWDEFPETYTSIMDAMAMWEAGAAHARKLMKEQNMKTFNFSANGLDFGEWLAQTKKEAQEKFASDAGYKSWTDMCERAGEFGGNNVEIKEV